MYLGHYVWKQMGLADYLNHVNMGNILRHAITDVLVLVILDKACAHKQMCIIFLLL